MSGLVAGGGAALPSPGLEGPGMQLGVLSPCPQVALAPALLRLSCPQVYDTPPMAVKGPNGRDPSLDVYDVPPSVEKGLPPASHHTVSAEGMLWPRRVLGVTVCALQLGPAEQGAPETCLQDLCDGDGNQAPLRASAFSSGKGSLPCRAFSRRFLRASHGIAGGPQNAPSEPGFF